MRTSQTTLLAIIAVAALLLALRANVAPGAAALAATEDSPDPRIAVCDLVAVMDELMSSDRFAPAREEQAEQLRDELIRPLIDEGRALEQELRGAAPDDPANEERRKRLIELREIVLPQLNQKARLLQEQFAAKQAVEAYDLVAAAARDIAADRGFNFVIASADPAQPLEQGPIEAIRNAILGRPVVMMPPAVDISDDVRDDLHL